jgi:hypothetical protein
MFLASLYARSGNKQNTLLGSATEPPPPLDDEIRRLVGLHGWEAVAKSAKKLAKPNKRKELERQDRQVLGRLLLEEARKELDGLSTLSNVALAKAALPMVPHTDEINGHRRLMDRMADGWRQRIQAISKIELASKEHPWPVLIRACQDGMTIKGVETTAKIYKEQADRALNDLNKLGGEPPTNMNFYALERLAARARMSQPVDYSLILGPGWEAATRKG